MVDKAIQRKAEEMYLELSSSSFSVVLVPPKWEMNPGGMLRALEEGNPAWYSAFCREYMNCRGRGRKKMRRARTYIDKRTTLKALERILEGNASGVYGERLVNFIQRNLDNEKQAAKPTTIRYETLAECIARGKPEEYVTPF